MTSDPVETAKYILRHYQEAHGDVPPGTWMEKIEPITEALLEIAEDLDDTDYYRQLLAQALTRLIAKRGTETSRLSEVEAERDRYIRVLDAIAQAATAARAPFRKGDAGG